MTVDQLFTLANLVALAGWVLLALAPLNRRWMLVAARGVGVALALAYVALLGARLLFAQDTVAIDFSTLSGVTAMFARPEAVLVGWVHYLAFDLWVGAWVAEDAHRRDLAHWLLLPCLALTFMFGPAGLLLYLAIRGVRGRRIAAMA